MPKRFRHFLHCAALFFLALQSSAAFGREPSRVRTILILGDSLTDGYGLARKEAYPALLAQKIDALGLDVKVINAGVSGDTSAGGLRRVAQYLDRPIDLFVLELGINDAFRGVPTAQIRANLQTIVDAVRAKNPQAALVIAGMQLPLSGADGYVREFGELFRSLAAKNNATLIPYLLVGVGGDPALNLRDRIHPNAAGQRVLAETVWQALAPLFTKAAKTAAARVD